jgi:hypothetical protein
MNTKEQLNKIRTLLGLQVKLEQATLLDGAVVEAEQFAPEYSIGIVTEDGIVPMPVGTYETQDGKIITVEVEGVIAKVEDKPAEVAEPEMATEPAAPQPKQIKEIKEINFKQQKPMKKGKIKIAFTEEAAEEVVEVSSEILDVISDLINAETPDEVSAEEAKEIATDVIEAIVEILEEQPEAFRKKKKFATQVAEPIVHNPENKQQQPIAYVKSKSLKSEIYKNLFN